MTKDMRKKGIGNATLKFFSIDNSYRRRARFYPALVTIAMLLPIAIMLGIPLSGWLVSMAVGGGLAISTAAVGLISHLAAAAGNRVQAKLYPRWPNDSPTNLRLSPSDTYSSKQQKQKWYEAIQRLTGIDIDSVATDDKEAERAINDAIVTLRTKVFHDNPLAERLDMHNGDYGQVRNFTGLRPVWLLTSLASCAGCWAVYWIRQEHIAMPVVSTALLIGCVLAAITLDNYVRQTARHYADSFFGTLDACDQAHQQKSKRKSTGTVLKQNGPQTEPRSEPPLVN